LHDIEEVIVSTSRDNRWKVAVKKEWRTKKICPICGYPRTLEVHHIIPRGNLMTRYLLINGIPCCHECHIDFDDQESGDELVISYIGNKTFKLLNKIASGFYWDKSLEVIK